MHEFANLTAHIPIIEQRLDYRFSNKVLLTQAFTHRSFLNETTLAGLVCNERLEFLGDAALDLYTANFLFFYFPDEPEGTLSKHKAQLICQKSCSTFIETLDLVDYLLVAKGQQNFSGKTRISLGADLFEAILGAIFIDGNWSSVENFLTTHFQSHFINLVQSLPTNAKAQLQETLAKKGIAPPEYTLEETTGPDHASTFTISVSIEGVKVATASGNSKKEAEQRAAQLAQEQLK